MKMIRYAVLHILLYNLWCPDSWSDEPNVECNEKAKAILWRQKKYGLSPHMLLEQTQHLRSSWS